MLASKHVTYCIRCASNEHLTSVDQVQHAMSSLLLSKELHVYYFMHQLVNSMEVLMICDIHVFFITIWYGNGVIWQ